MFVSFAVIQFALEAGLKEDLGTGKVGTGCIAVARVVIGSSNARAFDPNKDKHPHNLRHTCFRGPVVLFSLVHLHHCFGVGTDVFAHALFPHPHN